MQVVRIRQTETDSTTSFSASNPAPPSALILDSDIPLPQITQSNELLIRIRASTVTRDELTWPETYREEIAIPGHDFSGTVVAVSSEYYASDADVMQKFNPGDEVYGMTSAHGKGSTWAEYAVVPSDEISLKPKRLDWAQSATVPMSALTAWQALFEKAGISPPDFNESRKKFSQEGRSKEKILITGASGAVGTFLVQFAALAGLHVVAASTSNDRNREFLLSLGAMEVFEYDELEGMHGEYDVIIDTVGSTTLERCWSFVKDEGTLITIDSLSFDFVEKHRQQSFATGKDQVKAIFFIVEPSGGQLEPIAIALDLELLKVFVAQTLPMSEASKAYQLANERSPRRGKIVLTI
ncbi:uncharacterized protein V1513DRAFT_386677 [Lipomyces chichibuensis]|uniref:uncharacterized protein n=1 Tax=Lipomyces chichibuensis TaxID=1546026 RepID=UPI003343379A